MIWPAGRSARTTAGTAACSENSAVSMSNSAGNISAFSDASCTSASAGDPFA
ncbi:hypothetical protein CSE45_5035 [Citreicella sp. SE45]|nr:hypothetical protein CSE45_5035 [Citreicella sp. SE45]